MAIQQTQFRVADTTVGKRQGYLCYLRSKPYKLFLKPDGKNRSIQVMAKTDKYTVDLGVVPGNEIRQFFSPPRGGRFCL